MRRALTLSLGIGFLALLAACQPSTGTYQEEGSSSSSQIMSEMSSASSVMMEESSASSMMEKSSVSSKVKHSASSAPKTSARIVTIVASNFQFTPNQITVKKGEKVTLVLRNADGVHGLMIQDLGINVAIPADGSTTSVMLPTDTAGVFTFRCSVPCGPGHRDMTGTIIVEA